MPAAEMLGLVIVTEPAVSNLAEAISAAEAANALLAPSRQSAAQNENFISEAEWFIGSVLSILHLSAGESPFGATSAVQWTRSVTLM
jgi:hypothetical protein